MDIAGKVAIVTGASSGIGLATAELLAERGAAVALVARSIDRLESLAARLPDAFPITADMADERQVREMVAQAERHYERIDILVNNAGRRADDRRPPPDTAEQAAETILEAITTGAAEVYAHDWMRQAR